MKIIRSFLVALLTTSSVLSSAWAQQAAVGADLEIWGTVRLWAPAAQRIEVDGKAYRLARDVQVLDRNTRLLPSQRVRAGVPVMLLVAGGETVTHVVVNPGTSSPFDKVR